ncbi:hypothetical protein PA598K_01795 [Paenibacillus sp. 598K]|uniref:protein kinase family protein n=1 Tax=Paenibacillus sp. 598K TaxID=1117987 RepID=UPI000FF9D491|nr:protein kinase family protein [Paenibacillus sp. 598K]GBF73502.1 hypothetical protein PA598K_01795 [Paenibacillus sp. 598K]
MSILITWSAFIAAWRDYPLEPGRRIGRRYVVQALLGMGSYGLTYLATDTSHDVSVAIKQARRSKGSLAQELLKREAEALQAVRHPRLPVFRGLVSEGRDHYLVMSYLRGDTLEQLIFDRKQRFTERDCARIALQLLTLVAYVHAHGYVHLDLRIPNVLFHDDELYLIDFGLARRIGEPLDDEPEPVKRRCRLWPARRASGQPTKASQGSRGSQGSQPPPQPHDKRAEPADDLEAVGHFMLFMLYSTYEPDAASADKPEPSWQEELTLSTEMRRILERLLRLQSPYAEAAEVIRDLQSFDEPQTPPHG